MGTREEIISKADELERMSQKLHEYANFFKNLANKVEEIEQSQKSS